MNAQKYPRAAQQYLRTSVLTATPEQLQLMLYDGAVRFCEQAREALEKKNYEQMGIGVSKAQKIITELLTALRPDVYPQLCDKLSAIYKYVYRLLIDASTQHHLESIDEAIKLLKFQRETWATVLNQAGREKAGIAANKLAIPAPEPRMEASISMSA
jgi:flagellar protein FliS